MLGALGNDARGEHHSTGTRNSFTGERNVASESQAHDAKANFLSQNVGCGEYVHVTDETAGSRPQSSQRAEALEKVDVCDNSLTGRRDGLRQTSYARANGPSKDS